MFTILSDNINKQLNTQSYNIVLSNYAQISTLLEIACVARGGSFFLCADGPIQQGCISMVLMSGAQQRGWVRRLWYLWRSVDVGN